MSETSTPPAAWKSLSLPQIRTLLRARGGWPLAGGLAVVFAIVSMLIGGMVTLTPVQGAYAFELIGWSGTQSWWFYPEFLGIQPWGIVQLPWFPTLAMVLVSLGAGMGGAAGLILLAPLLRKSTRTQRQSVAGVAAGTAPAAAAFATVGACCCTSCGTAAGLVVVAATSGTTVSALLLNSWYLALFQVAVVYAALLFQDRALRRSLERCTVPRFDRRLVASSLVRLALLIAGLTWAMAMFAEWSETNPWTAPTPIWYHWIFEHLLLSGVAIGAALFPAELQAVVRRGASRFPILLTRVALVIAALSWGAWVPPSLVQLGLGGFTNELFGYLGLPVAWGAESPDVALGPALYFHWAFQHLLLSGFALAIAAFPNATLGWLSRSTQPISIQSDESRADVGSANAIAPAIGASSDGFDNALTPPARSGPSQ